MKKPIILIAAMLLPFCFSCQKQLEEEPDLQDGYKRVTLEADFGTGTKAADDFKIYSGDKVSVYCTDASNSANTKFYTFTSQGSGTSVTLSGSIPSTASVGSVALYPASDWHYYSSSHYYFNVDENRNLTSSSAQSSTDRPMYGTKTSGKKFSFTPLAGAAKYVVSGLPSSVTKVKFTFTASSSKINGSFKIYNGTNYYSWNPASSASSSDKKIVRYCNVVNGTASMYIPYAEGTIWGYSSILVQDYSAGYSSTTLLSEDHIGDISVTRGHVTTINPSFVSAYGIDWSSVASAGSPSSSYPAIKAFKAKADDTYLYIYLETDPAAMGSTTHNYDNVLNIYLSDGSQSNSSNWIWNKQATEVSAMGGWLRKNGSAYFSSWGGDNVSSSITEGDNSYIYEIRYKRSMHSLLSGSSVLVGAYVNNNWQDQSGANSSNYTHVGILPAPGGSMYAVSMSGGSGSGGNPQDLTFHEKSSDVVNPERGLYRMNEYNFNGNSLPGAYVDTYDDNSLVMTLFYLYDYVRKDHLPSNVVDRIGDVFDAVRAAGKKAIVRFGYSNSYPVDYQEPKLSRIKNHLDDLADVLDENKDVIYVVQAGFIGAYGEWYYTTYFPFERPSASSNANSVSGFDDRITVLRKILDVVPPSRQVEVRAPYYKRFFLDKNHIQSWSEITSPGGTGDNERIGFHNDAFLYGGEDMGTFPYSMDRTMWEHQSEYLICGGEAPYSDTDPSQMAGYSYNTVRNTIFSQHYSYLHNDRAYYTYPNNPDKGSKLMRYWYSQGWMTDIQKWLGYRLYLSNASISDARTSGSTLTVSMKIKNSGAARVMNERPMKLVLLHGSTPVILKNNVGDIRKVASDGGSYTYTVNVSLPQNIVSGDKLAIWLPDAEPRLQDRPEYSIRLVNSDVTWSNGYNVFYTF
ncbi:protein of unknown function [Bacteroidales bacterium WCE2008]|nr:protein of unknown function [Bacteroidales bacterium WCE2008]